MNKSRRDFVKSSLGMAGSAGLGFATLRYAQGTVGKSSQGVLYEGIALAPRSDVYEATLRRLDTNQYWLLFSQNNKLVGRSSTDNGRTWSKTFTLKDTDRKPIDLSGCAHLSLLHMQSGRLAIVYGGPNARPGRDGTLLFRTSADNGSTWSKEVAIDPLFAVCRTQAARVLSSGRILVPVMKWISPYTGANSEDENNNLAFSWVYYSDDEGKTWHRSLSELLVFLDKGRRGYTHFEETVLEELSDGRLLMFGRTELGRPYRSFSDDQGISWTTPEPVELASAYTPSTLIRIPATKDLLLVWNQASTKEILTGLSRHRLSTAVSKDEGETWSHFRNLESMDDRVKIEPPQGKPKVYRMENYAYRQPTDLERYPNAPSCSRICYPTVAFGGDEVTIAYDYGRGVGEYEERSATKVKIVSLDWLYEHV